MAKSTRSGTEHNNKTTIPFRNSTFKKKFPFTGCGGGDRVLKRGFILETLRKLKINNEAYTPFNIEKIKLLLTMPRHRVDLLRQMPHPGEDKAVKCPTNARGGGVCALGIDGAIKQSNEYRKQPKEKSIRKGMTCNRLALHPDVFVSRGRVFNFLLFH